MIPSLSGRSRVRAVGTAFAALVSVVLGVVAISLSDSGWHVICVAALLMAATVAAVILVLAHVRLGAGDVDRAVGMLRVGAALAGLAAFGLLVVGGLAGLLVAPEGATIWVITWFAALLAAGPVWFAAQGLRDAEALRGASAPPVVDLPG